MHPAIFVALALCAFALDASAADRREKIAVMKVEAATLSREEAASLLDGLEVGVTQAVGSRLQVITKDSAAASVGRDDKKLATCLFDGTSCDAEIGGALGVDYFVSASVRSTTRGLELGVTVLRIGREVSLLKKEVKVFASARELLDGSAAHAEVVTRAALGGVLGRPGPAPVGGTFGESGKELAFSDAEEVVVSFESAPDGAVVQLDGALLCAATPCRKRVAAGAHEASFQKERYAASVQRFAAAKGAVVKATLAPRFGWISVETAPPGIGVAIDGSDAGKSPVAWRDMDEGTVEVAVNDPCWLGGGERVLLKAGERRVVRLEPRPRIAGLKVNAEDEKGNAVEADVSVDGTVVGTAGLTLKVPVCAKKVSVSLGKQTYEGDLRLEEGKVAVVNARPGGMVRLPGGTFKMQARGVVVKVQPFLLDMIAVTVAAYERCVRAGGCSAAGTERNCNWGKTDRTNHPVNCVTWNQAKEYCTWAGMRLPTEEEREWAARGADRGTRFPWGDDEPLDQLCWDGGGSQRYGKGLGTCPVGSFPAGDSLHGLKDLAGNVWEWTSTAYDSSEPVVRGGSWRTTAMWDVAAASRITLKAYDRDNASVGFRCAKTP
jgi:formylglycine-generating enzyme required for sulfatase activity